MVILHHQDVVQRCPICRVSIVNGQVQFATGNQGTRAQLYARVCRYARIPGCINQNRVLIGEVMRIDGFPSEERPLQIFLKPLIVAEGSH